MDNPKPCKCCLKRRAKQARQLKIHEIVLSILKSLITPNESPELNRLIETVTEPPAAPVPGPTPPKIDPEPVEVIDSESEDDFEPTIKIENFDPPSLVKWQAPYLLPGETYLIPHETKSSWVKASLASIGEQLELVEISSKKRRFVRPARLGFAEPPDGLLRTGGRVLARLQLFLETGDLKNHGFRLGIVAEAPNEENKYRYLIGFDSGYWLYVHASQVRPIFETGPNDWMQMEPCRFRREVERFLTEIDASLRQVAVGERVRMRDRKGYVVYYYVLQIEGPIALLYNSPTEIRWVYLGSDRILD